MQKATSVTLIRRISFTKNWSMQSIWTKAVRIIITFSSRISAKIRHIKHWGDGTKLFTKQARLCDGEKEENIVITKQNKSFGKALTETLSSQQYLDQVERFNTLDVLDAKITTTTVYLQKLQ